MQHTICTSIHPPYLWQQPVTDPYRLLAEFFDYTSIDLQHRYTDSFAIAATTAAYVKEKPGRLLSWYEKTLVLFYAARLIHQGNYPRETDIRVNVSQLPWKQQPHHLEDYEVKDPYITIEETFEYMPYDQWLIELHTWLHAALHEYSVLEEVSRSHETITLLHKLADAMWLLHLSVTPTRAADPSTPHDCPAAPDSEGEDEDIENDEPPDVITAVRRAARAFFDVQPAAASKADLWRITKLAVCHPNDPDPIERDNMLYLYELLCGLVDELDRLDAERKSTPQGPG